MKDVAEVEIVELDPVARSGSFKVAQGFDFEAKFNELAKSNEHISGWSKAN